MYTYNRVNIILTHLSILKGVTISGKVRFWAIERGTPT